LLFFIKRAVTSAKKWRRYVVDREIVSIDYRNGNWLAATETWPQRADLVSDLSSVLMFAGFVRPARNFAETTYTDPQNGQTQAVLSLSKWLARH
jgi:hypothetical protein